MLNGRRNCIFSNLLFRHMIKFITPFVFAVSSFLILSCSLLPGGGFFGGESSDPKQSTPTTEVGEVLHETTSLLTEFRWWMLLAILFFPQARQAASTFIQAVFTAMTVPFKLLNDWYQARIDKNTPSTS